MYLKKLKIRNFRNFRNFREQNNEIEFVNSTEMKKEDKTNVAAVTTLIVGKNNAGKTTIVNALDKLINTHSGSKIFGANDFNYEYLKECLEKFKAGTNTDAPKLEFCFTIGLEDGSADRLTNMVPFMLLEDVDDSELDIIICYEVEEQTQYIEQVNEILQQYRENETVWFQKYLKCINELSYKLNYYDKNHDEIDNSFKIDNLITIKVIKANKLKTDTTLSDSFNKIIEFRYKNDKKAEKPALEKEFDNINEMLYKKINEDQTKDINEAVSEMVAQTAMKVDLRADVTLDKVIGSLIKYEYIENELNIPENQFGLGYTNLMMIIASLLNYMYTYPDTKFNSKINLISIEEPETYMHPQMQELFITNINAVIAKLAKDKVINSQLIVTTHSSHILNSKIHSGNTFDNINYVYKKSNSANVATLNNDKIVPSGLTKESEEFKFLKKHIKYKVSELFFSDAVIFVEGFAEETILPFYIENNNGLNKYHISVFGINGAHAYLYKNLLKTLTVPALVITDLDIKKEKEEEIDVQVDSLQGKSTTNNTLIHFLNNDAEITSIKECIMDNNIYVTYQGAVEGYYATSFEEALILTNYNNDILNTALKKTRRNTYNSIVGTPVDYSKNKEQSKKWQNKLAEKKGEFASNLLFEMVNADDETKLPKLPKYIEDGFKWLETELGKGC